tara:strand:- start:96 stop:275 length:180 start_codon:yes stop_codon:yes gene_type:complete
MRTEHNTFITALGGIEFTVTNLPKLGVASLSFATAIDQAQGRSLDGLASLVLGMLFPRS